MICIAVPSPKGCRSLVPLYTRGIPILLDTLVPVSVFPVGRAVHIFILISKHLASAR